MAEVARGCDADLDGCAGFDLDLRPLEERGVAERLGACRAFSAKMVTWASNLVGLVISSVTPAASRLATVASTWSKTYISSLSVRT